MDRKLSNDLTTAIIESCIHFIVLSIFYTPVLLVIITQNLDDYQDLFTGLLQQLFQHVLVKFYQIHLQQRGEDQKKNSFTRFSSLLVLKYSQNYYFTIKNYFGKYFLKNSFVSIRYVFSPLKPKLKQFYKEIIKAQPNKLSACNLGNVLTTKKK